MAQTNITKGNKIRIIGALIMLIGIILYSLSSCTFDTQNDSINKTDKNENQNDESSENECAHVLTESIYKAANYGVNGSKYVSCSKCDYSELKEIPALPPAFECTVLDKFTVDNEMGQYVAFNIEFSNISEFSIDMISGTLNIVGNKILLLQCKFEDLNLSSKEKIVLTVYTEKLDDTDMYYEVSKSIYDTPFENLKFQFETIDIVVVE